MDLDLGEYALLKLIAAEWSLGKKPPLRVLDMLRERYGVATLGDLDRIVHEMHKKIMQRPDPQIRAKDDGLVITGLILAAGNGVIDAAGDGWRHPLYVTLDYVTVSVTLSAREAVIGFNLDGPVDEVTYVLRYYDGIDWVIDNVDAEIEGDELVVRVENPNIVELAENSLVAYGFERVGFTGAGGHYEYRYRFKGVSRDEAEAVAREIIAAYTVIASEGYPEPETPRSVIEVERFLKGLRGVLPLKVSYKGPRFIGIHVHEEEGRVDVHVAGKVVLEGDFTRILPSIVGVVTGLNENFEQARASAQLKLVADTVRKLEALTGTGGRYGTVLKASRTGMLHA